MSDTERPRVSRRLAKLLERSHEQFNGFLIDYTGKKITFVDFTDLLAQLLEGDIEKILARGMVQPIKKGRNSKYVKTELIKSPFEE